MYKIFNIEDKKLIKELIELDPYKLLDYKNFSSLIVEVDYEEEYSFINLDELYVFIDYDKAKELL